MSWVRIHDGAMSHPKVLALSDRAFRVWVNGLSYCQMHLTDGFIPKAASGIVGTTVKSVSELCSVSLWKASGDGWQVHDYLHWNDSREVIRGKRDSAAERKAKWQERTRSERVPERVGHTQRGTTPTPLHATSTKNPPTPHADARGARITRAERKRAEEVRRIRFGCQHEPKCANSEACIVATVVELRAKAATA